MTYHFDSSVLSSMQEGDGALVGVVSTCASVLVGIGFAEEVLTHEWLVLPGKLCVMGCSWLHTGIFWHLCQGATG